MTDQVDSVLQGLQREYLAAMPDRLDELRSGLKAMADGDTDAPQALGMKLHRIAGSGGSYGFVELSAIAREGERWLGANPSSGNTAELASIIERLPAALQEAQLQLSTPSGEGEPVLTPRATLIMRASPQRERIAQELRGAGYEVRFAERNEHPGAVPSEQFPHLLIIGGEAGDGDLSAVASTWTNTPDRRPGAVVLVETLRPVDRLRAIAAGVDAVFPAEQVDQKLLRYARTFARIGPPPSCVVYVEPDPGRAESVGNALQMAHVRVVHSPRAHAVGELLDREKPDLLLLSTRAADSGPIAQVRVIRQDPRYQLLPILLVGEDNPADRIRALRAGADDFLPHNARPDLLVQSVIARAARGRRIRELVHRDGLTGLLNHATLMAELELAVEFSQRYGEPLAFVIFELEGLRGLAERLGPRAGEEVLLHAAGVFRSNVRASDVIGRYGWEAFGMLLRGANAAGASVLAQNLHRVLGQNPATTSGGERVVLQVNVGTAVFPRDGTTAAELAQEAGKRVRR